MKNEKVIEDLAWEVFLRRTGLRFKRELTLDERKSIADADPENYQKYRDEAIRIFEKKQAALINNKKYPIFDVPASGKPNWGEGAFTLCFVYSKHHGNFILRGYLGEVMEYLQAKHTHYFCYISMWHRGFSRGHWKFWKERGVSIYEPSRTFKRWKYEVVKYDTTKYFGDEGHELMRLEFKRMPHRWIPEFDKL